MILLCCGSRYWNDKRKIEKEFDKLERDGHNISLVIEGEADGADTLARCVAEARGIPVCGFFANWSRFKNAAGPIRNASQIKFITPDLVLAFHSNILRSRGTADMVRLARRKGIKVKVIT